MSSFNRLIACPRSMWSMAGISLILISIPFIAAALDGVLDSLLSQGYWYHLLQAPVVILYILFVSPWMGKSDADMLKAFRPLLMIDEDHYDRVVREASRVNPIGEVSAAMLGFRPRPSQTPYEYAAALGDVLPSVRPEIQTVAHARLETVYGCRELDEGELQRLRDAIRRIRLALPRLLLRRPWLR